MTKDQTEYTNRLCMEPYLRNSYHPRGTTFRHRRSSFNFGSETRKCCKLNLQPWDRQHCHKLSQILFSVSCNKMVIPSEVVNNEEHLTSWGRPQTHSCTLLCGSCKRYPAYLLQLHSVLEEPHGGSFRGLQATVWSTVPFKNRFSY